MATYRFSNPRPYSMPRVPFTGAMDFSHLLDAPAGKHGFLKTDGQGHFRFEDGTTIRFFGGSILGAATRDHAYSEMLVSRLASAGVNMVRLHNMDANLIDTSVPPTALLAEQLRNLDYFQYLCRERGIYIHVDLYVTRYFTKEWAGLETDEPEEFYHGALKQVQMYHPRLIELQKQFAKAYLTHVNPYTGLRWIDDPAIAVIQVVNENSVLWSNGNEHPWHDRELDELWCKWLTGRYGTESALAEAWTDSHGVCALGENEHLADCSISHIPVGFWIEEPYMPDAPSDSPGGSVRHADFMRFLADLERDFISDMKAYLKDLGMKCLFNGSNHSEGPLENRVLKELTDVAEGNTYWNHPLEWDRGMRYQPIYMNGRDPRIFPQQYNFTKHMVTDLSRRTIDGMPFIIGEFNTCNYLQFKADMLITMTAYGCLQDWNGMLFFAIAGETQDHVQPFSALSDPSVFGMTGICASIFYNERIRTARRRIDVVHSDTDLLLLWKYWEMHFGFLPFVSRIRCAYGGESYQGNADFAVTSGSTASSDLRRAAHSLAFCSAPLAEAYSSEPEADLAAFRSRHMDPDSTEVPVAEYPAPVPVQIGSRRAFLDDVRAIEKDPLLYGRILNEVLHRQGVLEGRQGLDGDERIISDTEEILWDFGASRFTVSADTVLVISGHNNHGQDTDRLSCDLTSDWAALILFSLDGETVSRSKHLLLSALGYFQNTDSDFPDGFAANEGHAPLVTDEICGTVRFASEQRAGTLYPLASDGTRTGSTPLARDENGYLTAELGNRETCTVFYELILD